MSAPMIVLALFLTGLLGGFVLLPIFEPYPETHQQYTQRHGTRQQNQVLETLHAEKWRVLRAVRDLDFDYDLGKLPDTVYAEQRVYLIRLAVAIMQRLDTLEEAIAEQEVQIEELVASFRHRQPN